MRQSKGGLGRESISGHRVFQKGVSDKKESKVGTVSTAGRQLLTEARESGQFPCGLIASLYSLKAKKTPVGHTC